MDKPDDYKFVEPLFDEQALQPIFNVEYENEWERELYLQSALVPLYLGKNIDSSKANSFDSIELTEYAATFYERSRVYHSLFNDWISWVENGPTRPYATKRAGIHIFAPLYAQELEGPMRYQVAALTDLLNSFRGRSDDWSERRYNEEGNKYFPSILNECIQVSNQFHDYSDNEELNDGFEFLTTALVLIAQHESHADQLDIDLGFDEVTNRTDFKEHPGAGDIRDGFAHADYKLRFDDAFELDESNIDIDIGDTNMSKSIDAVIAYIHRQLSLIYALSTGVTLALYHISIREDYDDQISVLWNVLPGQVGNP